MFAIIVYRKAIFACFDISQSTGFLPFDHLGTSGDRLVWGSDSTPDQSIPTGPISNFTVTSERVVLNQWG